VKALRGLGGLLATTLVGLLALPVVTLAFASSFDGFAAAFADPSFAPAVWLSLWTTTLSLTLMVAFGTPLAWWLASSRSPLARVTGVVVELPIIIPPAVVGVALLLAFGRRGVLGETLGLELAFTEAAVVMAQVVVASPFYVQAAANAFREVDPELVVVARTLGASPARAVLSVALPIARRGLVVGASIAWARALGEFGATLLFAGNLRGETQTMPLAIFTALEGDVRVAVVLSLVLVAVGATLLVTLRVVGRAR